MALIIIGVLLFIGSIGWFIVAFIKKSPQKYPIIGIVVGFILTGIIGPLTITESKEEIISSNEKIVSKPIETPIVPKKIDVSLEVEIIIDKSRNVSVYGKTNLPDGMNLSLTTTDRKRKAGRIRGYLAQAKVIVKNGEFFQEFGDYRQPDKKLVPGKYKLEIISPLASAQPPHIQKIIGENAENLIGKFVKSEIMELLEREWRGIEYIKEFTVK